MYTDSELLSLLVQDPGNGLKEIMSNYRAFVCTIVHGKLALSCNRHDMEECVSDIFYEVYKNRSLIDLERGSLKSYIAVLAKRNAIDTFNKSQKHSKNVYIDGMEHDWLTTGDNAEQNAIDNELQETLTKQIKLLGEPDSQIMIRKYYFGQSTKTISKALGIKVNTVDKKVSRALGKLKKALGGAL
jgi:RNA polymerase sigma-70 factor (ECF subfamily)